MTVSSSTSKVQYNGNGSTTVFAYTFKIFDQDDLTVIIRSASGTETTQTITTHYTVSGVGADGGGNVTMLTAPASGETITILREQPLTQGLDLVPNDPFPANSIEDALDKLTFMVQSHSEELDRAIKASRTNTITSTEFTVSAADRANKIFAFDGSGELSVTQELGTYRGNWAASTAFAARDIVKDTSNNNIYICVTSHTSSGSQPISSNADSAKWALLVDAASATTSATNASASASAAATSATNAANSATAAAASESAAATSASNASTSETNAASSATNASNSATAAAASETAAGTSETNAASSATAAASSASAAATSASNASTSETNAASSASTASTAATTATTQASAASTSATNAATSASNAATSATNAATSEANAASSESAAATSATSAAGSASAASASATAASASETAAAASETAAAASETAAATSATNAATSATTASSAATTATTKASEASTSASNAATSETNAATSATSAASAQTAAESARDATLAAYDNFDDRYLGSKTSDPTLDNDGNALVAGSLYFNSTAGEMRVYTGSAWVAAYVSGTGFLAASNNLSDLANAATARTNLGLGTAATTASTDYATAAQGTNADTAFGWGNHASAGYLTGNQTITLSGDVSGSGTTSIVVTVADDSHNHVISNVDGLQTALDSKAALAGSASQAFSASTLNATTVDLGDWTVTESVGVLYFAYQGVNKMKVDSSGNLTVTGNVTAYGTV